MFTSQDAVALALELGFDSAGVAALDPFEGADFLRWWIGEGLHGSMRYLEDVELRADPVRLLPGAKSALVVSLGYAQSRPEDPKIARYALGRDYHRVLRGRLKQLARGIQERVPGAKCRACVDSAPLLERELAHRAGLGWFGKNTMLIDSRRGSWFFLGVLLTDLELPPSMPSRGGCGTCTACIDACPTGAIVFGGGRWHLDARRCISYQTIEHRGALEVDTDGWVFGCDVCQEVCPFNQTRETQPLRAVPTSEPEFGARPWPRTSVLADLPYEAWDLLTQGSAVRRAGWEGLRRNARAVQNKNAPSDEADGA